MRPAPCRAAACVYTLQTVGRGVKDYVCKLLIFVLAEKDSNLQHSPPKGDVLPLNYPPMDRAGLEPAASSYIQIEGLSQLSYRAVISTPGGGLLNQRAKAGCLRWMMPS